MRRVNRVLRTLIVASLTLFQTALGAGRGAFDVREYGAAGDGKALDTEAINEAIDACAAAGGGKVLLKPGRYLCGTLHLKSHVTLFLEAGAVLVGTEDLDLYQQPKVPGYMPEATWGKWHRGLILGHGAEDIGIAGQGIIDGNKVFDPTGEERMRGPHTFVFVDCRGVTVRDVSFVDSANYAIFFQVSDEVEIRNVKFAGGWDGVHFRGAPQRPCRDVSIAGCRFYTGDDCIAGRYWEDVLIADCIINSSCNGIRLIGPARQLTIRDCLFYGPGVHPHRTSNRHNMLAGINLQPGAWDATRGDLDAVRISDVTMHNVATPFHFSLKPGNTAGRVTVSRAAATGVYRAACSVESWAETPFADVVFRDVSVEFEGGGTVRKEHEQVKAPGVDARVLPAWGFYTRNVGNLCFENVRLSCAKEDQRPVMICEGVKRLTFNDFAFSRSAKASELFLLSDVAYIRSQGEGFPLVQPRCTVLRLKSSGKTDRFVAGRPFSAVVTVTNSDREGLGRIDLWVAGRTITNWVWLRPNEEKDVVFGGLTVSVPGTHEITAGNLRHMLHFADK